MSDTCPVCRSTVSDSKRGFEVDGYSYSCPRCGNYQIQSVTDREVGDLGLDLEETAVLSHWIRTEYESIKKRSRKNPIILTKKLIDDIIQNPRPSFPEQADNFVRWLGDSIKVGGQCVDINQSAIPAIVGSATLEEFSFIFDHLETKGTITVAQWVTGKDGVWKKATPSYAGWEHYLEIKRATRDSRKAFMAMEYGHPELDTLLKDVLKPAVEQTGFDLFILPERPKAGLLDDRLRVEIRTSRFLIADLTHENAGAYWEAGYAEGLGKPVIYTCKKEKFEAAKTHFDTNHHLTIRWDVGEPEDAAEELKATIRATLPGEAKLADE